MATAYGDRRRMRSTDSVPRRRVDNLSVRTTLALALSLVLVVACSSSGGGSPELSSPPTSAAPTASRADAPTPPPTPVATATEVAMTSQKPFTLTSPAFDDGAPIPRAATCDGADRSPALDWTGAPAGTEALALVVIDPDARDFVHWVAFDMTGAPDGHLAADLTSSAPTPARVRTDSASAATAARAHHPASITTCSRSPPWTDHWASAGRRRWQRSRRP